MIISVTRPVTIVAIVLLTALAALIFTGDGYKAIFGGAHNLDIKGEAKIVAPTPKDHTGWFYYGGDAGGNRYSSLSQITPDNVNTLTVAWTYSTSDMKHRPNHCYPKNGS